MNYTAPNSAQLTHLISTLRPPLKPVRQIRQPTYFPKHYRTLREIDVKRIVMARFHSLTDCSKIFASFPEISKRHRIPLSTCFYAIKAFQQRGLAYVNKRLTNTRPPRTFKIKDAVLGYLKSYETLQKWTGLTLLQRCKLIRKEFGIALSPSGLKRFYNRQGVKYLTCSYSYQQSMVLTKQ